MKTYVNTDDTNWNFERLLIEWRLELNFISFSIKFQTKLEVNGFKLHLPFQNVHFAIIIWVYVLLRAFFSKEMRLFTFFFVSMEVFLVFNSFIWSYKERGSVWGGQRRQNWKKNSKVALTMMKVRMRQEQIKIFRMNHKKYDVNLLKISCEWVREREIKRSRLRQHKKWVSAHEKFKTLNASPMLKKIYFWVDNKLLGRRK